MEKASTLPPPPPRAPRYERDVGEAPRAETPGSGLHGPGASELQMATAELLKRRATITQQAMPCSVPCSKGAAKSRTHLRAGNKALPGWKSPRGRGKRPTKASRHMLY